MAKILLADDEEIFCNLLQGILSSHGHEVLTAYNGREALKLFRQHHPQITVLDIRMPEMHGVSIQVPRDRHEALALISQSLPQLIVLHMDLTRIEDPWRRVPKMTAAEFLDALRQTRYPGRLILMSNMVDHAMEAQASKLQTIDHLQKPVTPDRLLVAIQIALPTAGKPPTKRQ